MITFTERNRILKTRIISVILLLGIWSPALVIFSRMEYHKYSVKCELKNRMIRKIGKQALVLFKFSKKETEQELSWEHGREFSYKGNMYDVVESGKINDSTYFWCWPDHEETWLNLKLMELVSIALGKDGQEKSNQSNLLVFYKSLFFENTIRTEYFEGLSTVNVFKKVLIKFERVGFSPPTPPPEAT